MQHVFLETDFLAINGYDEFFEGWGKEDDDLTHRLQRKGCKKRSLRFPASYIICGMDTKAWKVTRRMQNISGKTMKKI